MWKALTRRPDLARDVHLNVLNYLGMYYINQNQPSLAIPRLLQVLHQAPHDTIRSGFSSLWLCYCYYLLRQPRQGLPYGQLSVRLLAGRPPYERDGLLKADAILGDCASLLPTLTLAHSCTPRCCTLRK